MHCIYQADTALDAYMIRNLLEQQGIEVRLDGEYLPGAGGELPAGGLVRVMVSAADSEQARRIIDEWETQPSGDIRMRGNTARAAVTGFFIGAVAGAGLYAWASHHDQVAAPDGTAQPCSGHWYVPEPDGGVGQP